VDFTANYVVVGDLATAAGLSALAFVVGPFAYLGHEKLWDYYGSPRDRTLDLPAARTCCQLRADADHTLNGARLLRSDHRHARARG